MAPKNLVAGPWGGQGGDPKSFAPKGAISHISITYSGAIINSVRFSSKDEFGNLELSDEFGCKPGPCIMEIDINPMAEKLISISGTFGMHNSLRVVTSLCFTTDMNKSYGPFGSRNGTAFSYVVIDGERISGFHGRAGWHIDAIGVYLKPKSAEENLIAGPWGGQGGDPKSFAPNGAISHISITYSNAIINTIRFTSRDEFGSLEHSDEFGCKRGTYSIEINIDPKNEKLNGISGTYGMHNGLQVVTSLCFTTNKNKSYGPFGSRNGTAFSFNVKDDESISGFHGRAGWHIDAIGVYLKRKRNPSVGPSGCQVPENPTGVTVKPKRNMSVGPWGNQEPQNQWTYNPKGAISNISITHDDVVYTIRFTSQDDKGNVDHSETFGWTKGCKNDEIVLDIKNETLIGISGTVGVKSGYVSITSLSFSTSTKKTFGPFGTPRGTAFSLLAKNQGFIGFHGRSGSWLDAIGVYLKPLPEQSFGQWGEQRPENSWSYVPKGAISHISFTHDDAINTIRFTSQDDKGNLDHSKTFGWTTGTKSSEIDIDIKKEKLNNISGTTDMKSGYLVVTSLSFSTDKNTVFGPFGTARGTAFSARLNNGTLSGFFGRSGYWLDAIGVVVKPTE